MSRVVIIGLIFVSLMGMNMIFANPLFGTEQTQNEPVSTDPIIVGLAGLIIPGGGWFMLGDSAKFIKVLLITAVGYILIITASIIVSIFTAGIGSLIGLCTIVPWFYSLYEAYQAYLKADELYGSGGSTSTESDF